MLRIARSSPTSPLLGEVKKEFASNTRALDICGVKTPPAEPVRRQVKVAMTAHIASSGTNWIATMVESGTKPAPEICRNLPSVQACRC